MSTTIWQKELLQSTRSIQELTQHLDIDLPFRIHDHFPIKVTPLYLSLITKKNPYDPLLLQVISPHVNAQQELHFTESPLSEKDFTPIPGLIHKYENRLLLLLTSQCMIHCQYCFRQHFPYLENQINPENLEKILAYIQERPNINEIILSGGDPLLAKNNYIERVLSRLSQIKHISTIRIHSRVISILPKRIDKQLSDILKSCSKKIVIVNHINHPNELCAQNIETFQELAENHTLLNQSVLLNHVNNDPEVLAKLSQKLFSARIIPYYLHLLDPVIGAEFYALPNQDALRIYQKLQAILPGYLVPKLVREIPGKKNKTLIST